MPRRTAQTNKTAQVLRLLTKSEGDTPENPIINEDFKEEVIHPRSVKASPAAERKPAPEPASAPVKEATEINVISELVSEWLPQTLERFKCCTCELCRAELTVEALNQLPPKYVRISSEEDLKEAERLKEELKPQVLKVIVPLAIRAQRSPRHNP